MAETGAWHRVTSWTASGNGRLRHAARQRRAPALAYYWLHYAEGIGRCRRYCGSTSLFLGCRRRAPALLRPFVRRSIATGAKRRPY